MKKIVTFICVIALTLSIPFSADAQGFLGKLKNKVTNKALEYIGLGEESEAEETKDETEQSKAAPDKEKPARQISASDKIQKLKSASAVWADDVKPSGASSVEELLKELPPLPSAEEMAHPTDAARETYYNKLVAVDLRVNELDEQFTCSDEEMVELRNKYVEEIADIFGITVEEMNILENPDISEEAKEPIHQKIQDNLYSLPEGADSAAAELEALEKKYDGNIPDEEMAAFMERHPDFLSSMMETAGNVMEKSTKIAELTAGATRLEMRMIELNDRIASVSEADENAVKSCDDIAARYENKLKKIYSSIAAADDPGTIDKLYEEADDLVSNYRSGAAVIWRKSLLNRLNTAKTAISEVEDIYSEAVEEGVIPACAAGRPALNIVTACSNILNEAYADFPQPSVLPVQTEAIYKLGENETIMWAESGFANSVGSFMEGSSILISDNTSGEISLLTGGKKKKISEAEARIISERQEKERKLKIKSNPYGTWTSDNGKRSCTYSKDGSLTLHDGTSFYPVALEKQGSKIVFVIIDGEGIRKCTYKL